MNSDEVIFAIFLDFDCNFGTLSIRIDKIGLQIQTRGPQIGLHANFSKFGSIISLKINKLAFFGHLVVI